MCNSHQLDRLHAQSDGGALDDWEHVSTTLRSLKTVGYSLRVEYAGRCTGRVAVRGHLPAWTMTPSHDVPVPLFQET